MRFVFVVLSPSSPFPLRIAGKPATFIDRMLNVPDAAEAATTEGADKIARRTAFADRIPKDLNEGYEGAALLRRTLCRSSSSYSVLLGHTLPPSVFWGACRREVRVARARRCTFCGASDSHAQSTIFFRAFFLDGQGTCLVVFARCFLYRAAITVCTCLWSHPSSCWSGWSPKRGDRRKVVA